MKISEYILCLESVKDQIGDVEVQTDGFSGRQCAMWVDVNENLPADDESVLISCADGVKEAIFWAANVRGNRKRYFFHAPDYGHDQLYCFKGVTHWTQKPAKATPRDAIGVDCNMQQG